MNSEVSYFLPASPGCMYPALGAVESHQGVLIKEGYHHVYDLQAQVTSISTAKQWARKKRRGAKLEQKHRGEEMDLRDIFGNTLHGKVWVWNEGEKI